MKKLYVIPLLIALAAMAIAARFGDGPIESPLRAIAFSAIRPSD